MKLRKSWISGDESLPVATQCQLIDVNRTSYYIKPKPLLPSDEDQLLMRLIDEESRSILFTAIVKNNFGFPDCRVRAKRHLSGITRSGIDDHNPVVLYRFHDSGSIQFPIAIYLGI